MDFGPPIFRFFNSWLLREDLDLIFLNAWASFLGYGSPNKYLAAKLHSLQVALKNWNVSTITKEYKLLYELKNMGNELKLLPK